MQNKFQENVQYHLEINKPGSAGDVWVVFQSERPFLSINTGDIINPGSWGNSNAPMKVLKVVSVEHIVWEIENSHIAHKLCVFTEEVEDTRRLRLGLE